MKIAIVLTVKNEVRLLRNNLLYHKAIGVDRAFVYFDNTTDKGKESIADLDFVNTSNSVSTEKYASLPYLKKFTSQAVEHHTARQCLNTYDAQVKCKEEGIDWLISIDADELICTDFEMPSNLKSFFNAIPNDTELVDFRTLEVLQQKERYNNVFAEESNFKVNKQVFYLSIKNPFTKSKQKFPWWYGHTMGKSAIRIDSNLIPHNVHRYKHIDGASPNRVVKGNVLHYHAYDAEDFIKKFTNFSDHPDVFLSGNKVEDLKLLLRDVVNNSGMSRQQLECYFKENLMFTAKQVRKFKSGRKYFFKKIDPKPLQLVESVVETFKQLNY
ncbi:glycosyl transferase family 2 [Oceanihabitans sediminis]|uniref:glycosyltransferase family 2 protein n=1 Tax=Oceanihabitans sediminis TaxID=1812012 RepID=UPI000E05ED2F|nr:glycosyltransferase family 2 protein [Oceanihabitans sediminis]RBP27164.1 glycosyl transferase family 2 [Oceanihabitans sediminis]